MKDIDNISLEGLPKKEDLEKAGYVKKGYGRADKFRKSLSNHIEYEEILKENGVFDPDIPVDLQIKKILKTHTKELVKWMQTKE
jgi:hypothetical protein